METKGILFPVGESGKPLLATLDPSTDVLCLENDVKSTCLYLVKRNGEVNLVPRSIVLDCMAALSHVSKIEHCLHPDLLRKVATVLGAKLDPVSEEVAAGRWAMDVKEQFE